jgi:hypothetical protein
MVIFHSYVKLPEGKSMEGKEIHESPCIKSMESLMVDLTCHCFPEERAGTVALKACAAGGKWQEALEVP